MKTSEANIEITRADHALSSISVIMPTWKHQEDNSLSVNIPLFGIKTFAKDIDDTEAATNEAITCFCIASEKFGQGIEKELEAIGWVSLVNGNNSILNYSIESSDIVLEQIMETGDQFAKSNLSIA